MTLEEARADLERQGHSPDEIASIEAHAYAWRSGLALSLAEVGFHGPDAEREYLELVAELYP